jgi:hypothetical protein
MISTPTSPGAWVMPNKTNGPSWEILKANGTSSLGPLYSRELGKGILEERGGWGAHEEWLVFGGTTILNPLAGE